MQDHFIGIGGIGMSAIAENLQAMGIRVQGSNDVENETTKRLVAHGIPVYIGQNDISVLNGVDVVIISSAIHSDNLELKEAIQRGIHIGPQGRNACVHRFRECDHRRDSACQTPPSRCAAICDRSRLVGIGCAGCRNSNRKGRFRCPCRASARPRLDWRISLFQMTA